MLIPITLLYSCKEEPKLTFESYQGEAFDFHSPITALSKSEDSSQILVATSRGTVASFNPDNGLFSELSSFDCGTIYDMCTVRGKLYYSVQDGGIRCGDISYSIEDKGLQFSPYSIFLSPEGSTLYAATSNGAYRWDDLTRANSTHFAKPIMKKDEAKPLRIYNIKTDVNDAVVLAGEEGICRIQGHDTTYLYNSPVVAMHGEYFLTNNGAFHRMSDLERKLVQFNNSPVSFQVVDSLIYAVSLTSVEIADTKGNYKRCITLPEKNTHRIKNNSLRNICLVHDSYIYIANGENALYRIPLGLPNPSERMTSICDNKCGTLYALSSNNDLYEKKKDHCNFSYVRSFPAEKRVRLLDAFGDTLIVLNNDTLIYLFGTKKTGSAFVQNNLSLDSKVTCRYFKSSDNFYEGRIDCIRKYDSKTPDGKTIDVSNIFYGKDTIDYYPTSIDIIQNRLVFATLHSGVFAQKSDMTFCGLLNDPEDISIKDINSFGQSLFILTSKNLSRFHFSEDTIKLSGQWRRALFSEDAAFLNRIVPKNDSCIYLYSNDYPYCRGIREYELSEGMSPRQINKNADKTLQINNAFLESQDSILISSGNMGVAIGDLSIIPVLRPSFYGFRKWIADTYWWGILIIVAGVLFFVLFGIYLLFFYPKHRNIKLIKKTIDDNNHLLDTIESRQRRTEEEIKGVLKDAMDIQNQLHFHELEQRLVNLVTSAKKELRDIEENREAEEFKLYVKEEQEIINKEYPNGYIPVLFSELVLLSNGDLQSFKQNIGLFKKEENVASKGKTINRLKLLDEFGGILNDAAWVVNGDGKLDNRDIEKQLAILKNLCQTYIKDGDNGAFSWDNLHELSQWPSSDDLSYYFDNKSWYNSLSPDERYNGENRLLGKDQSKYNRIKLLSSLTPDNRSSLTSIYITLLEKMKEDALGIAKHFYNSYKDDDDCEWEAIFSGLEWTKHKLFFLLFPICDDANVVKAVFLEDEKGNSYSSRKSEWASTPKKEKEKEKEKEKNLHHLSNLASRRDYGGLLGLIAKAGLHNIQK